MPDEIYRIVKQDNFVVLDRRFLHNPELSWKAKGILAYVLSLPNDWKFYIEELAKHSTDGEKGLRTGWNELVKHGYINRVPIREGSRIASWETQIYEHPSLNPLFTEKGKVDDYLLSGFVDVQKLHVQNGRLLKIDSLPSIDPIPNIDPYIKLEDLEQVRITQSEYDKLTALMGSTDTVKDYLYKFAAWIITQTPAKQKKASAYLSVRNWYKRDSEEGRQRGRNAKGDDRHQKNDGAGRAPSEFDFLREQERRDREKLRMSEMPGSDGLF